MKITVFIPVKSLDKAKSRLAKYLSDQERKELVLSMLGHVIKVLKSVSSDLEMYVVTNDTQIKKFSDNLGVQVFFCDTDGMNRSLTAAVKIINNQSPLAVISADLPLLTAQDITAIMTLFKSNELVFVSSKESTGTNALFMKAKQIPFLFGENSLQRFLSAAQKNNIKTAIYTSATSAFDVDTISDYRKLQKKS